MNEFLGLATYPTLRAVTLFNDKILGSWALEHAGADSPKTVASFDEADALEQVAALGTGGRVEDGRGVRVGWGGDG